MDIINRLGIDTNKSKNSKMNVNKFIFRINDKSFNIGFENLLLTNSINEIIDNRLIANGESFKDKAREIGSKIIDGILALWTKFKRLFIKLKNKFLNLKLVAKIKRALSKTSKGKKKTTSDKNNTEIEIEYPVTIKIHEDLIETFKKDSKRPLEIKTLNEISKYVRSVSGIEYHLEELRDIYKEITEKKSYDGYIDKPNSKSMFSNNGTMNAVMDIVKDGVIFQKKLDNITKNLKDKSYLKDLVIENEMHGVFISLRINAALKMINEKILPNVRETSNKIDNIIGKVDKLLQDVKKVSLNQDDDVNLHVWLKRLKPCLISISTYLLSGFNKVADNIDAYVTILDLDINQLVLEAYKKKKSMD